MSAINGICLAENALQPEIEIKKMQAAIPEFAHDGQRIWFSDAAAFGFLKMARTPQAVDEILPYEDQITQLVITADARLDNHEELKKLLGLEALPDLLPDSFYLLEAYKKWGDNCPGYLLGDFAFSIWDPVNKKLFLARDFCGAKPLYYAQQGKSLVFSSNLNAILTVGLCFWEYDERVLVEFLLRRVHIRKGDTFYKGIRKLPQACCLVWQDGQVRIHEYWSIREKKPVCFQNETDYVEQFQELFSEAVFARMRSNGRVGSHISGGLDSSSVTLLANEILNSRGEALSGGYSWSPPPQNGEVCGELELLDWVARTKNIPIRYCDLTPEEAAAVYARDITRMPTNTLFSEVNILEKARRDGTRVMLSGWGGDEIITFNGRGYFSALFLGLRWRKLAAETHAFQSLASIRKALSFLKNDFMRVWGDRLKAKRYLYDTKRFYRDFLAGNLLYELNHQRLHTLRLKPGVHQNQVQLWNNGHIAGRMEDWHHQGAFFGVEYRYPLLDRRIVEFALGIPEEMIFHIPWRGYLMRLYARRYFPEEMIWVNLKKEDYRQPVFQQTLRQGLELWQAEILAKEDFSKSNINSQNLLNYLRNTDFHSFSRDDRHRLRRLLQVASLPEE